jgi:hypothetical protein
VNKALDTKSAENTLSEVFTTLKGGFPLYGLPVWLIVIGGMIIVLLIIAYSVAGKGQGSHAGREEVRRSYRGKLAQEMAKQDAALIKEGKKPRRRWMQW